MRWTVWFLSEWENRRFGTVSAEDALVALDVARSKFSWLWLQSQSAAPGGTLAAIREGAPAPVARLGDRGEFFAPKVRYASRANGPKVEARS